MIVDTLRREYRLGCRYHPAATIAPRSSPGDRGAHRGPRPAPLLWAIFARGCLRRRINPRELLRLRLEEARYASRPPTSWQARSLDLAPELVQRLAAEAVARVDACFAASFDLARRQTALWEARGLGLVRARLEAICTPRPHALSPLFCFVYASLLRPLDPPRADDVARRERIAALIEYVADRDAWDRHAMGAYIPEALRRDADAFDRVVHGPDLDAVVRL
jgi:hypothetical protein